VLTSTVTGSVCGDKNERFRDCCVKEHDRFGGPSVLVWGGVSYDGPSDLYIIQNGALTGVRYVDENLHDYVRPTLVLWVRVLFSWMIKPGLIEL